MAGVNKVILLGRLGQDPEMTYTPSGMAVCKFSLATSKKKKDGMEVTAWHRCTAFGKTGEILGQYMSKGRELYVEGELQYGQYEKDGITRYTTDIIIREFNFISSGGGQGGGYQNQNYNQGNQGGGGYQQGGPPQGNQGNFSQNNGQQGYNQSAPQGPPPQNNMPTDDDIPF